MDIKVVSTVFFACALLHTFLVSVFAKMGHRFSENSARGVFFHLMSEVEVVFGFWAFLFLATWAALEGIKPVIEYQQSLNMTEPLFIFCIMILASTRPLINLARQSINSLSNLISKVIPANITVIQYFVILGVTPLLGSLITEPAAITMAALLLYRMIDKEKISEKLLYATLGLLFVNVSVGGALTHFAAPPILIVARVWNWGLIDVFKNLGEAALATVILNTLVMTCFFKNRIRNEMLSMQSEKYPIPMWVTIIHMIFLAAVVATSHYEKVFFGLFLIFMGFTSVTRTYQDGLKFKEGFLVAFFLAGLVVFGPLQRWWLEPALTTLNERALFLAATGMTAFTDNAALTFLGSQVPTLSETSKWALVSGAVTGGGLTILANAPNPAGFSILSSKFRDGSLNAVKLFLGAVVPTLIALICFLTLGKF